LSAFLLQDHHNHDKSAENEKHRHDHNLKAAYFHVLADALTSILAIIALLSGKYFGWSWMDPIMGLVGSLVITRWSFGLLQDTSPILLDHGIDENKKSEIKKIIETDSDNRISDIHIWKVGPDCYAASISLVTHFPKSADHYKNLLSEFDCLTHITIEVNPCYDEPCIKKSNLAD